jgi:hypothetical protein
MSRHESAVAFRPLPCDHRNAVGDTDTLGRIWLSCSCGYSAPVVRRYASEVEPPKRTANHCILVNHSHNPRCSDCKTKHVSHVGATRCRDCSHERRRERDSRRHRNNRLATTDEVPTR